MKVGNDLISGLSLVGVDADVVDAAPVSAAAAAAVPGGQHRTAISPPPLITALSHSLRQEEENIHCFRQITELRLCFNEPNDLITSSSSDLSLDAPSHAAAMMTPS